MFNNPLSLVSTTSPNCGCPSFLAKINWLVIQRLNQKPRKMGKLVILSTMFQNIKENIDNRLKTLPKGRLEVGLKPYLDRRKDP